MHVFVITKYIKLGNLELQVKYVKKIIQNDMFKQCQDAHHHTDSVYLFFS